MSKTYSQESDFDCSAYLSHGLQWPVNEPNNFNWFKFNNDVQKTAEKSQYPKQRKSKSVVRDWGVLLQEEMNAASQKCKAALVQKGNSSALRKEDTVEKHQEKQYYESEYNTLVRWMDEGDSIVPPPSMFADKREEIQRISVVADEVICRMPYNSDPYCFEKQSSSLLCEDIANEVALKAIETPRPASADWRQMNVQDYNFREQHPV